MDKIVKAREPSKGVDGCGCILCEADRGGSGNIIGAFATIVFYLLILVALCLLGIQLLS